MNDDGIVRGPAFDLKNFGDGFFIQRIGRKAINRLGRQRHHFTRTQQVGRAFYSGLKKCRGMRR